MTFKYRVKDKEGTTRTGTIEARTQEDAIKVLRERAYLILDVKEGGTGNESLDSVLSTFSHVGFSKIVDFTRQLSTMIIAGLPLVDSLSLLEQQEKGGQFKHILEDVIGEIKGGGTLAIALKKHPNQFNKIYTSLVASGEQSGKLDVVLDRLALNLEKEREFKGKVKTAMIYPVIVVTGMVALTMLMMIFVIPKMTEIYEQFNVELPLPTRILIGTSHFFVNFWWLVILAIIGLFLWIPNLMKTEGASRVFDSITLRMPIIGSLKREMLMAEFTRTIGLLIGAGVSILEALNIVAEALGSPAFTDAIYDAAKRVEKGFPLGVVISNNKLFPPIVGQMVTVGEETGKVDDTMTRLSRYFESQADEKVKRLSTAIEPIVLVLLGIGVAFLVLSIVLPMYQLTQAF